VRLGCATPTCRSARDKRIGVCVRSCTWCHTHTSHASNSEKLSNFVKLALWSKNPIRSILAPETSNLIEMERLMAGEDRIGTLDGKIEGVRSELYSFKTEVAKEFGAVRGQIAGLRTEMIERIGNLKIWVLLTAAGAAGSLVSMFLNIASLLRGWKS